MIKHFKKTFYVLCGAAALISVSSYSAKAQHVVTQNEAAKLTLDSLTAKPVVHYHAKSSKVRNVRYVRNSRHSNVRVISYTTRSSRYNKKLVRNVSYNHIKSNKVAVKSAVYKVSTSHKKTTAKHRHRS